jgi:hypothetical protein
MNDLIQKWKQRELQLGTQMTTLANKIIMDEEDAIKQELLEQQNELIKEIINDLQHYD